ncbi:MAG: hypothetical protein L0338_39615 [Acidobacteria bacterium]|nr:hypothetical protein [Acidobacteriota bacterium]
MFGQQELIDHMHSELEYVKRRLDETTSELKEERQRWQAKEREWEAERKELIETIMIIRAVPRPGLQEEQETVVKPTPVAARRSWHQALGLMELQSKRRVEEHRRHLAELAKRKQEGAA